MAVDVHTPSAATDTLSLLDGQSAVKAEDRPTGHSRLRRRFRVLEPEQARWDTEKLSRFRLQKQLPAGLNTCILHLEEPPLGWSICPGRQYPILADGSSLFNSAQRRQYRHPIEKVIDPQC
jgi:hypothetical protein